jgi:hypothetical protein
LNIGGDIRAWGDEGWPVGIANPFAPAENAPLLGCFILRNAAVATSGGYSRFVELMGRRCSHIIDPRTLRPASQIASATVVAADCLTANALSTAANVLGMDDGARLARLNGAREYFLVDARGQTEGTLVTKTAVVDSPAGQAPEKKAAEEKPAPSAAPAWPTNFQVKINVNLKTPAGGRVRRPYVAVWVEDASKKVVRTVAVWGADRRWLREMTWWRVGGSNPETPPQSVTRATRAAGNYALEWDGLNDKKEPVPQGEYKIFLEINRESGRHVTESVVIQCGADAKSVEFRPTAESEASKVEYGPKAF